MTSVSTSIMQFVYICFTSLTANATFTTIKHDNGTADHKDG